MDEEADAGDDQQHDQRKLIEEKAKSTWKVPARIQGREPTSMCGSETRRDVVRHRSISTTANAAHEASSATVVTSCLGQPSAEQSIEQEPDEGQHRNQPEMEVSVIVSAGSPGRRSGFRGCGRRQ